MRRSSVAHSAVAKVASQLPVLAEVEDVVEAAAAASLRAIRRPCEREVGRGGKGSELWQEKREERKRT